MITSDGWIDWAIRLEPTNRHVNPGINPVRGIVMHSAEGYASVLLDPSSQYGYNGNHSWHLSNLMDGRLFQHYPLTARCWHGTALNQEYVGVENEGDAPKEASLNDAQVANARRFIPEIAEWKGWNPRRPAYEGDTSHSLWEHNETVWLGGDATACPSGRIPWDKILEEPFGNSEQLPPLEDTMDEADTLELADRRAAALVAREIGWPPYGDGMYRPVSVAEDGNMLYLEFWPTAVRIRPADPVPGIWVRRPD